MDILQYLKVLFPKPPTKKTIEARREQTARNLTARYAEGNLQLSRAKYITTEQAAEMKKKALEMHF